MTGKTKGLISAIGMVAGIVLLIWGLTRDGENGGATLAIVGGLLFVGSVVFLSANTPGKRDNL